MIRHTSTIDPSAPIADTSLTISLLSFAGQNNAFIIIDSLSTNLPGNNVTTATFTIEESREVTFTIAISLV